MNDLMKFVCKDSDAFKHLFKVSLQKMRFQTKVEQ